MLFVRSLVFNVAFYVNLVLHLLVGVLALMLPREATMVIVRSWGRTSLWLLRVVCGLKCEVRGLAKLPPGGLLVAAKHQSLWETFVLPGLFDRPVFILKRELTWIPVFGWMAARSGAIPVDRGAGAKAMTAMLARARAALAGRAQIVIFPEGTRRAPGAAPAYKFGVARMYAELGVACVPVALNSGLFWPRRKFARYPGTVVIEILDPIPPGLAARDFFARMQTEIETATERLVAEAVRADAAAAGRVSRPVAAAPTPDGR